MWHAIHLNTFFLFPLAVLQKCQLRLNFFAVLALCSLFQYFVTRVLEWKTWRVQNPLGGNLGDMRQQAYYFLMEHTNHVEWFKNTLIFFLYMKYSAMEMVPWLNNVKLSLEMPHGPLLHVHMESWMAHALGSCGGTAALAAVRARWQL